MGDLPVAGLSVGRALACRRDRATAPDVHGHALVTDLRVLVRQAWEVDPRGLAKSFERATEHGAVHLIDQPAARGTGRIEAEIS
ncbi:hypothetical protein Areg01_34630 [Actinoplanes regularis]|nr:hypothetical protein Areg01_34630 [Actinoplanes regularis]